MTEHKRSGIQGLERAYRDANWRTAENEFSPRPLPRSTPVQQPFYVACACLMFACIYR